MVDAGGVIGWAPASFLVPVDEEDLSEEAKENEQIVGWEKGGWGNRANSTKLFKGLCISWGAKNFQGVTQVGGHLYIFRGLHISPMGVIYLRSSIFQ